MVISGFDTIPPQRAGDTTAVVPTSEIRIYSTGIRLIRQDEGYLTLRGDTLKERAPSTRLLLTDVQFAFDIRSSDKPEEFNQLSIESINSNLLLDDRAHIRNLHLRLDSNSTASIRSSVEQVSLDYDDQARIALDGATLKKLSPAPGR